MRVVSFTEARNNLKTVLDSVVNDADTVVITRRDSEDAVVMSLDYYNSLRRLNKWCNPVRSCLAKPFRLLKITAQSIAGLCLFVVASSATGAGDSVSPIFGALKASRHDGTPIHYYLEMASNERPADTLLLFFQGSDCNSVA